MYEPVPVSAMVHLRDKEDARIECVEQRSLHEPEPYPVLGLGPVSIFLTEGQLRQIQEVIDGYFARKMANGKSLTKA